MYAKPHPVSRASRAAFLPPRTARRAVSLAAALAFGAAPALADQSPLFSATTGTVSGLQLTNSYNAALNALATCNSGASPPSNPISGAPVAGQCWLDTTSATANVLHIFDGAQWLTIAVFDTVAHVWKPVVGGGSTTIASATTTDLGSAPETSLSITGTTTITGLGATAPVGSVKLLSFAAALTLTYNATALILPTGANITTAPGDTAIAVALGAGNWRIIAYQRASGGALTHGLAGVQTFTVSGAFTADPGTNSCIVEVQAAGGGSGGSAATSTSQFAMGSASSAGSYARAYFSPCSPNGDTVTIGAVGAAGVTGGGAGGTASATTVGAHVSCPGGIGGAGAAAAGSLSAFAIGGASQPAACTVAGALTIQANAKGGPGPYGFNFANNTASSGPGGASQMAQGPPGVPCNTPGIAGNNYGTGAAGALTCASASGLAGGAGGPAIVNIYEFN